MDRFLRRNAHRVQIPALMFLAKNDPIVDNQKNVSLFNEFSSPSRPIREFSDVGHTLEFEKDIRFLVAALAEWIDNYS
jgi:esterase/lipase